MLSAPCSPSNLSSVTLVGSPTDGSSFRAILEDEGSVKKVEIEERNGEKKTDEKKKSDEPMEEMKKEVMVGRDFKVGKGFKDEKDFRDDRDLKGGKELKPEENRKLEQSKKSQLDQRDGKDKKVEKSKKDEKDKKYEKDERVRLEQPIPIVSIGRSEPTPIITTTGPKPSTSKGDSVQSATTQHRVSIKDERTGRIERTDSEVTGEIMK